MTDWSIRSGRVGAPLAEELHGQWGTAHSRGQGYRDVVETTIETTMASLVSGVRLPYWQPGKHFDEPT
jgi:hypothetical protein